VDLAETAIRTGLTAGDAQERTLVLAAIGIASRCELVETGWLLLVPHDDAAHARDALDAYDEETRRPPAVTPIVVQTPTDLAWTLAFVVGASLLGFFAVTGPPASGGPWFERGAAASGPMLHGEPWRAVTALTLHLDLVHVTGNAVATTLLLVPVVQALGAGLGMWLVLAAGATANVLAAALQGSGHVAVGASTATFGAIGILAALRLWSRSPAVRARDRRWIVPVATVLLLAILGTGRGADVLAHALGLATGGALGLAAAIGSRPLAWPVQWALVIVAALVVVACWHLALVRGGLA
jgi:membrane associated rhomboid family serine protease